jgi:hypothetical protein
VRAPAALHGLRGPDPTGATSALTALLEALDLMMRRLSGSCSSRNSALASGTTRSWRPSMMVTGVAIPGSSSAS